MKTFTGQWTCAFCRSRCDYESAPHGICEDCGEDNNPDAVRAAAGECRGVLAANWRNPIDEAPPPAACRTD